MKSVDICGTTVQVDEDRTRQAYATIAAGPGGVCDCAYCRNFRAQIDPPFPEAVMAFFSTAGIDPAQPAETYQFNETEPGRHLYGGEYYFFGAAPIGEEDCQRQAEHFSFTFTRPSGLAQDVFKVDGAICFNFVVEIPWVLADAA